MAKEYIEQDASSLQLQEPATAYYRSEPVAKPKDWNPNVPFVGTQEEWWEHFHAIERGEFYPASETHQRISQWLSEQKK